MHVSILFFGVLKDVAGLARDELEIGDDATLGELFDRCAERWPALRKHEGSIVMARNREFAKRSDRLAPGDEVAFLPPVSGGAGQLVRVIQDPEGHYFALTRDPIETVPITERLRRGADGAVVVFEGTVRDNTGGRPTKYLDYEGYEAMAVETMARIGRELAATHEVGRIAMVHRLGRMEIGETSVVIAVTAPHRRSAFAAALEAIDRLKKLVPIWKKEYFADGEVWVDGAWDKDIPKA